MIEDKKRKSIILVVIILLIVFGILFVLVYKNDKDNDLADFVIHEIVSNSTKTGCRTVYVDTLPDVTDYSFDNGVTWNSSNYGIVCKNGEVLIKGRNSDKKVIAFGKKDVVGLEVSYPIINIDFDKKIEVFDEQSLLDGVTAYSDDVDISNQVEIISKAEKDNTLVVTYSVKDSDGNITVVDRIIEIENTMDIGTINFDKTKYVCSVGEKITTTIKASSSSNPGVSVADYTSSNINVAIVDKNPDLTIKSPNELAVVIDCKNVGETMITVTSSTGARTFANVQVKSVPENIDKISFDSQKYTCKVGEKIDAVIKATSVSNPGVSIADFNSSNSNVVTIDKNPDLTIKSPNELAVVIDCKNVGTTTLNATSSTGVETSVEVQVSDNSVDAGTISFEKNKYVCNVGESIKTVVKAKSSSNPGVSVSSYNSLNSNVVIIKKDPNLTIKSPNELAVVIDCKNVGITTINATSSTGAKTSVEVQVNSVTVGVDTIKFTNNSYTCKVGEKINTVIKATSTSSPGVSIADFNSSNSNVVTIGKDPDLTIKSPNELAVVIDCKSVGTTTLNATSSTGAKTSVEVRVNSVTVEADTIKFTNNSYTCKVGETINTVIMASSVSNPAGVRVSSYKSLNTDIALLEKDPDLFIKSPNEISVIIRCKSVGTTTLTATSSTGVSTGVSLVVTK